MQKSAQERVYQCRPLTERYTLVNKTHFIFHGVYLCSKKKTQFKNR